MTQNMSTTNFHYRLACSPLAPLASLHRFDPCFHQRHTIPKLKLNSILASYPTNTSRHNNTATATISLVGFRNELEQTHNRKHYRTSPAAVTMIHQDPVISDIFAAGLSTSIAFSILRLWEETAKRRIFNEKLNRKLVHISIGLVFMLCWPLFSAGHQGAVLAALAPGVNVIRMLLVGSGIWKDEATVKSMSRSGDRRELLKGPLYYAATIALTGAVYWRTSPIAIATICNLCAGDGIADIVGRRFGSQKIPYNKTKSIAGSVAMALAGFLASLVFMYYFASFGYVRKSWSMVLGFLVISLGSALVESLPISTELDDNLTVTLTSILLGTLVFRCSKLL